MEKTFHILRTDSFKYATYEDAEAEAKRMTSTVNCYGEPKGPYAIVKAVAVTKLPVPEIEVVKI